MKYLIGLALLLFMMGCSTEEFKEGDICSVDDGDGKIGIVKVLAVEPRVIHLRIYKNKFKGRPKQLDLKELSLGNIKDPDGFGIGHAPIDINGFKEWKPELITNEQVSEEELEGYKFYKENQ